MDGDSSDSNGIDTGKETKKVELSEAQKKSLKKAIDKQKKFMDGDISKKKVTKKVMNDLKTVEESGMSYHDVGKDLQRGEYYSKVNPTKCIVVKKLTKSLIDSQTISMLTMGRYSRWYMSENDDTEGYVEKGIRIGTILGKKLQVRGESRDTKWTRLDRGRIDKRLIAELGFGNDRVFQTTFVESYSDAFLHISVDASGSMGGDKWDNTMISVVAICKAASMITNVDVVVSFRSTQNSNSSSYRSRKSSDYPIVLIAYDSRIDKFSKVKNLFPHIRPSGTTPEGLCYEAIMNEIVPTSNDRDSYFLNFSDGMPMFGNDDVEYYHDTAINHTKKMVEEIKDRGIKVISYFIGDSYDRSRNLDEFKRMYGKDSEFIDVTSVMSISKTMNKKFLEK
jgi:hypothetical protein